MDPNDEASHQVTANAAAEVASLSCSISDGSSAAHPSRSKSNGSAGDGTHFQTELLGYVQTGHRGLETALQLLCERLLDLEGCWERTQEVSLLDQIAGAAFLFDPSIREFFKSSAIPGNVATCMLPCEGKEYLHTYES